MELTKYNIDPQEQLLISLYLKSMNKQKASSEAGYASVAVFNKPAVKSAISDQLAIRAERLRVGGDWVLSELKRVYDRCMQVERILDRDGNPTDDYTFDAGNALKALTLIGKHVDVRAFENKSIKAVSSKEVVARLQRARLRASTAAPLGGVDDVSFY
jgi:hypothetical protein